MITCVRKHQVCIKLGCKLVDFPNISHIKFSTAKVKVELFRYRLQCL